MTTMQQFTEFLTNYWQLWGLFFILVLLLIVTEIRSRFFGLTKLTPQEVIAALNHKEAAVLDVRSNKEFQEGHIIGAISVPLAEINNQLKKLDKYKKSPIIIACAFGNHANQAGQILSKQGFTDIKMLSGGMYKWQNDNLPVTK